MHALACITDKQVDRVKLKDANSFIKIGLSTEKLWLVRTYMGSVKERKNMIDLTKRMLVVGNVVV